MRPPYGGNSYALELEGASAGFPSSANGGYPAGTVVVGRTAPDPVLRKHIAGVRYEDINVSCGSGMSKELADWIGGMTTAKPSRKSGAIYTLDDLSSKTIARLRFYDALITAVELPELDTASNDKAELAFTITPDKTEIQTDRLPDIQPPQRASQKACLRSNFRMQLGGLDCSKVNKVDAIRISVLRNPAPAIMDEVTGFTVDVSNISITLAQPSAKGFYEWFDDFVMKGKNDRTKLKSGSLQLLSPDLREALFTFNLMDIGIYRIAPERSASSGRDGTIPRVRVDLYFEQMRLAFANAALG
jgi:hypothetical protein